MNVAVLKGIWLAIIVLGGVLIGAVATLTSLAVGTGPAGALKAGGAAFLGCASFGLAALMIFFQ